MRAFALVRLILVVSAIALAAHAARAQDGRSGSSYLPPFPQGDVYSVLVVGDDLAEGLQDGMAEAFAGDNRIQLRPKRYFLNGLMRPDFAKKLDGFEQDLKGSPVDIAVIMMGAWDRVSFRDPSGKKHSVGSAAWKKEYAARGDQLMKLLKRRGVSVYWVGLPSVRRYAYNEDAQMMNDLLRERIYLNGMKYIDAYAGFTGEDGGYAQWGPDVTGKIVRLRRGDGVYFTQAGNRKLAHFVERDLKRDLNQARQARSVPLLGSEAEQARINPDKAKLAPAAPGGAQGGSEKAGSGDGDVPDAETQANNTDDGGQKADPGKISLRTISSSGRQDVVTIDIVRPAIPASVVALVTRRERPDKPSRMGATLVDQIAGGLAVMSSVTPPLSGVPGGAGGPKLSTAQSPYYRVLFRGERLVPRAGRSDDVSWPRADTRASSRKATPEETGSTQVVVPPLILPEKKPD